MSLTKAIPLRSAIKDTITGIHTGSRAVTSFSTPAIISEVTTSAMVRLLSVPLWLEEHFEKSIHIIE